MARPREFDIDHALDQAVDVFHRLGYEGASLQDLQDAMGINRASLYAAFGDKHALFLRAMDRYRERGVRETAQALERGKPVEALKRLFQRLLQTGFDDPRGCLLVNIAAEQGGQDAEVRDAIEAGLGGVRNLFLLTLQRAHALGHWPDRRPADLERTADFLLGTYVGAHVLLKLRHPPLAIRNFVHQALQDLQ